MERMITDRAKKLLPYVALMLFLIQVVLMVGSWLYSAAYPMSGVHSLLSSEGLRWFLGHFADSLAQPLLVWIVLLSLAYGVAVGSGLFTRSHVGYRARRALWLSALLGVVCVAVVLLLTVVPHAVLLSATGRLWPSPFSDSLVPVVAFAVTLCSGVYGLVAGRFATLAAFFDSLLQGIRAGAPFLLFYVLLIQIYESLKYILSANPYF